MGVIPIYTRMYETRVERKNHPPFLVKSERGGGILLTFTGEKDCKLEAEGKFRIQERGRSFFLIEREGKGGGQVAHSRRGGEKEEKETVGHIFTKPGKSNHCHLIGRKSGQHLVRYP